MQLKLKKIKTKEASEFPTVGNGLYPPSFYVNDEQMPEVADWEVGKKYKLMVEVEMKSKSENKKSVDGSFDVIAYKPMMDKDPKDMDDKEFGEYQGKEMSKH